MKKLSTPLIVLFASIFLISCGGSDDNSYQSDLDEAIDEYNDATRTRITSSRFIKLFLQCFKSKP